MPKVHAASAAFVWGDGNAAEAACTVLLENHA